MKQAVFYEVTLPEDCQSLKQLVQQMNGSGECLRFKPLCDYATEEKQDGFTLITSTQGLEPPLSGHNASLFETLPNGFVFSVRMEDKFIPPSAVKAETDAAAARIAETTGAHPTRKEMQDLRDAVRGTLAARALSTTTSVTAFFHWDSRRLIVPVGGTGTAQRIVNVLLKALPESSKAARLTRRTKDALTIRLKEWCCDTSAQNPFHPLWMGDKVTLKGGEGRKATVDAGKEDIADFEFAIRDMTETAGMEVDSISLDDGKGRSFVLTSDFRMKSIKLPQVSYDPSLEDPEGRSALLHELGCQLALVTALMDATLEMVEQATAGGDQA